MHHGAKYCFGVHARLRLVPSSSDQPSRWSGARAVPTQVFFNVQGPPQSIIPAGEEAFQKRMEACFEALTDDKAAHSICCSASPKRLIASLCNTLLPTELSSLPSSFGARSAVPTRVGSTSYWPGHVAPCAACTKVRDFSDWEKTSPEVDSGK